VRTLRYGTAPTIGVQRRQRGKGREVAFTKYLLERGWR
jgi:hypothetical protein